ncbi:Xylose isomerase domain protein TIM barrel [Parafrankia sp. EUN1f]|nr:Xylose isomerase domain protein TIM barrel [Parafrankia sp. EUN1f]
MGYLPFSLREDSALRAQMIATMRDRGIRDRVHDLELLAELGAQRINTVALDPDLNRSVEQFGLLAEAAAAFGMETTVEPSPGLTIGDLPTALYAIRQVGRSDFRLLIDTMHIIRSGSTPDDVAALEPDVIGYIQLSDAPLVPTTPDYMTEAMFERMVPGTGGLPLLDLLAALPRDLPIGLEIPIRSQAEAGISPHDRLGRCVESARGLLAQL